MACGWIGGCDRAYIPGLLTVQRGQRSVDKFGDGSWALSILYDTWSYRICGMGGLFAYMAICVACVNSGSYRVSADIGDAYMAQRNMAVREPVAIAGSSIFNAVPGGAKTRREYQTNSRRF